MGRPEGEGSRFTQTPLKAASEVTIVDCCNADDIGRDEESEGTPPNDSLQFDVSPQPLEKEKKRKENFTHHKAVY